MSSSGRGCGEVRKLNRGDPERLHCGRGAAERKGLLKGGWRSEEPKWGCCEKGPKTGGGNQRQMGQRGSLGGGLPLF